MKISIIVTAYNAEKYITECLDSLSKQTLDDYEVIVVNDGSTDGTKAILESYEHLQGKLSIITQENSGPSSARNEGIKLARGEYITFIDSDDWMEKDALEYLYKMALDKEADIVISDFWIHKKDSRQKHTQVTNEKNNNISAIRDLCRSDIMPAVWNKLYKRELFFNNDILFTEDLYSGEDLEINIRLFYFAENIVKTDRAFIHYLVREDGLTKEINSKKLTIYKGMSLIEDFLKTKNIYEEVKDQFEILAFRHLYYLKIFKNYSKENHKYIYDNGIKTYFKIKDNQYYREHIYTKMELVNKVHLKLFSINYCLGKILLNGRHALINAKGILNKR
ncbi:glycosyltransferase family 2 protein [Hathewaya histolytica]|uniref:glycosyltransferase family 2 protein n=1 Tax=Hathewaya histolytica TaxID=1498 RepID=UPI003B67AE5D